MTLEDIVKKLAIGTAIYGALAIAPVDRNIAKIESPLNDKTRVTIGPAPENFNPYNPKGVVIPEPKVNSTEEKEDLPEPTKEAQERFNNLKKSTIFVLYHPLGELGYAESKDPFQIPGDWIIQIKIPHGYAVQQWWDEQKRKPDIAYSKDLMQRMILAVNPPKLYPKDFPKKFNLWKDDIMLPEGKIVNFIDFDHKGTVFGVIGQYLPKEEVAKILALKNDRGELLNGINRR